MWQNVEMVLIYQQINETEQWIWDIFIDDLRHQSE